MGTNPEKRPAPDPIALVKEIVADTEKLIELQFRLLRSEVKEELQQAKTAALSMGAGAGLIATGGILSALMLVHGLHRSTRLPLWSCYGLVGGLLGAMGTGLLAAGRYEASRVELVPPPQTMGALRENLEWLKDQTDPTPT